MTENSFWQLFYKTGLPVCYTLYCRTKREEERKEANQAMKTA